MKNKAISAVSDRDAFVYNLWDRYNLSFKQIANCDIVGGLSRKTIANYVYSRIQNTDKQKLIVKMSDDLSFLFPTKAEVIDHIHTNQPHCRLSETTIRRIVNKCRKNKQLFFKNYKL